MMMMMMMMIFWASRRLVLARVPVVGLGVGPDQLAVVELVVIVVEGMAMVRTLKIPMRRVKPVM